MELSNILDRVGYFVVSGIFATLFSAIFYGTMLSLVPPNYKPTPEIKIASLFALGLSILFIFASLCTSVALMYTVGTPPSHGDISFISPAYATASLACIVLSYIFHQEGKKNANITHFCFAVIFMGGYLFLQTSLIL